LVAIGSQGATPSARAGGVVATEAVEPLPADLGGDLLVFDLWRLDLFRANADGSDVRHLPVNLGGSDAVGVASGTKAAYGTMGGLTAGGYAVGASSGGAY